MSYIEAAFVSRRQYDALEDQRLGGEQFHPSALYVAMFALPENPNEQEAAKLPVEFMDTAEIDSNRWLASLAVLNAKGEPTNSCVGEFEDGYWTDVNVRLRVVDLKSGYKHIPDESYVRDYDPSIDADLVVIRDRLLTPA